MFFKKNKISRKKVYCLISECRTRTANSINHTIRKERIIFCVCKNKKIARKMNKNIYFGNLTIESTFANVKNNTYQLSDQDRFRNFSFV